eukprot:gene5045-34834_t
MGGSSGGLYDIFTAAACALKVCPLLHTCPQVYPGICPLVPTQANVFVEYIMGGSSGGLCDIIFTTAARALKAEVCEDKAWTTALSAEVEVESEAEVCDDKAWATALSAWEEAESEAEACEDKAWATALSAGEAEVCDDKAWAAALRAGVEAGSKYGGAIKGSRTMLDALFPAAEAAAAAADQGLSGAEVMAATAKAATEGSDSTKAMDASAGRSSYVPVEVLKTVVDPGAKGVADSSQDSSGQLISPSTAFDKARSPASKLASRAMASSPSTVGAGDESSRRPSTAQQSGMGILARACTQKEAEEDRFGMASPQSPGIPAPVGSGKERRRSLVLDAAALSRFDSMLGGSAEASPRGACKPQQFSIWANGALVKKAAFASARKPQQVSSWANGALVKKAALASVGSELVPTSTSSSVASDIYAMTVKRVLPGSSVEPVSPSPGRMRRSSMELPRPATTRTPNRGRMSVELGRPNSLACGYGAEVSPPTSGGLQPRPPGSHRTSMGAYEEEDSATKRCLVVPSHLSTAADHSSPQLLSLKSMAQQSVWRHQSNAEVKAWEESDDGTQVDPRTTIQGKRQSCKDYRSSFEGYASGRDCSSGQFYQAAGLSEDVAAKSVLYSGALSMPADTSGLAGQANHAPGATEEGAARARAKETNKARPSLATREGAKARRASVTIAAEGKAIMKQLESLDYTYGVDHSGGTRALRSVNQLHDNMPSDMDGYTAEQVEEIVSKFQRRPRRASVDLGAEDDDRSHRGRSFSTRNPRTRRASMMGDVPSQPPIVCTGGDEMGNGDIQHSSLRPRPPAEAKEGTGLVIGDEKAENVEAEQTEPLVKSLAGRFMNMFGKKA